MVQQKLKLTCIEDTTPLAMTDSFPATDRTPLFSCIMSGTAGIMLLRRDEPDTGTQP